MSFLKRLVRLSSPGVPAAILPGGKPSDIVPNLNPLEQAKSTATEMQTRAVEDAATMAQVAPYVAAYYTGGASMSAWTAVANLASSYLAYRTASKQAAPPVMMTGPTVMPTTMTSPMIQQTMGALPQVGRALPLLAGAGSLVVSGARAAARSAMVYCRRHPNWCSTIGGTAAVAAMIESGQLPTIKRRRGRGITPKDLRSFRRVANLVRGYCPTVRRIPSRALHVRKTGITHA